MSRIPGNYGEELKTKLDNVLKKNPGFGHIKSILKVLSGASTTFPEGMNPADVAMFKYCPTASVDVERSKRQSHKREPEEDHDLPLLP